MLFRSIRATSDPGGAVRIHFTLTNVGKRPGMAVGQVYASRVGGGWEAPKRLVGFAKLDLAPGETKAVDLDVDPRLLATFDDARHQWRIAGGQYRISLGASSADLRSAASVTLSPATLPANWRPGLEAAAPAAMPTERGE